MTIDWGAELPPEVVAAVQELDLDQALTTAGLAMEYAGRDDLAFEWFKQYATTILGAPYRGPQSRGLMKMYQLRVLLLINGAGLSR